jgi:hypothetical protein
MPFPLASGELRGIPNRDRTATFEFCCFLPWTWTLPQSMTSSSGLDGISLLQLALNGERFSKRALLRLACSLSALASPEGYVACSENLTCARVSFRMAITPPEFGEELTQKLSDFTSLGLRCALRFSQPHGVLFLPVLPERVSAQSHS